MSVSDFYIECHENNFVPLHADSFDRLDDIECQYGIDWIEYQELETVWHSGPVTVCGISLESAINLQRIGFSIEEIDDFLELHAEACA